MQMLILTTVEAAEELGTSASSISRAARKANVGVRREDGRLVGVTRNDMKAIKKLLRYKAGNPNFKKKQHA
jgi:hypothetical protein